MALPTKTAVFYIVREKGQPDRVFAARTSANTAFEEANIGVRKVLLKCTVRRKRHRTIVDIEL